MLIELLILFFIFFKKSKQKNNFDQKWFDFILVIVFAD